MTRRKNAATRAWIYALADPESGEHVYVGSTIEPEQRLRNHLSEAKQPHVYNHPKRLAWINDLTQRGLLPRMELLESAPIEQRRDIESAWVDECTARGCPLLNIYRPVPMALTVILPGVFEGVV